VVCVCRSDRKCGYEAGYSVNHILGSPIVSLHKPVAEFTDPVWELKPALKWGLWDNSLRWFFGFIKPIKGRKRGSKKIFMVFDY
jgi:hypothetical protein